MAQPVRESDGLGGSLASAPQAGAVGIDDCVVEDDLAGVTVLVEPYGDAVARDERGEPDVDPLGDRPDGEGITRVQPPGPPGAPGVADGARDSAKTARAVKSSLRRPIRGLTWWRRAGALWPAATYA